MAPDPGPEGWPEGWPDNRAMLRRLVCVGLGALLFLAAAGAGNAVAAPTEAEMNGSAQNAALAVGHYEEGNWELAAKHGQESLAVIGPAFGWDEARLVKPVLAITVDSLMKLGRNAEADALLAKNAAAEGGSRPAKPDTKPRPAAEQTPLDVANRQAGEAFVAFVQGRYVVEHG